MCPSEDLILWPLYVGTWTYVGLEFASPPLNLYPHVVVMSSLLPGPSLWSRKCPLKMVTGFIQTEEFSGASRNLSSLRPYLSFHRNHLRDKTL